MTSGIMNFIIWFYEHISDYIDHKYALKENYFTRNCKYTQKVVTLFILTKRMFSTAFEIDEFIETITGDPEEMGYKQGIGQSRVKLNPKVFVDMNNDFLHKIYNESNLLKRFKGYVVLACDGSIVELPQGEITRNAFCIPESNVFVKSIENGRLSCFADVFSNFILSSKIVSKKTKEIDLAIKQIRELKKVIDIKNTITIYDRGYSALKLMINSMKENTKFIIRIKEKTYQKERLKIGNDGIITLNMNKTKIRSFTHPNLKRYALAQKEIKLRIVTVELPNGELEYLATNIFDKNFTREDFKELYNLRWQVELDFRDLKTKLKIEVYSGYKKTIIEQDIYSQILRFNLAISFKITAEEEITRKPNNNSKSKFDINFNYIYGKVISKTMEIYQSPLKKKIELVAIIINKSSKILTTTEKNPPSNSERTVIHPSKKHHMNIKTVV